MKCHRVLIPVRNSKASAEGYKNTIGDLNISMPVLYFTTSIFFSHFCLLKLISAHAITGTSQYKSDSKFAPYINIMVKVGEFWGLVLK